MARSLIFSCRLVSADLCDPRLSHVFAQLSGGISAFHRGSIAAWTQWGRVLAMACWSSGVSTTVVAFTLKVHSPVALLEQCQTSPTLLFQLFLTERHIRVHGRMPNLLTQAASWRWLWGERRRGEREREKEGGRGCHLLS
jgi:hypothetical protein